MRGASAVLDASAVLALLFEEPGADRVEADISAAIVSAVNWIEVWQRVRTAGHEPSDVRDRLVGLGLVVVGLSQAHAEAAGELREPTRHLGLALADRCCLALGLERGLPVLTADAAWAQADVGADVVLIGQ